MKGNRYNSVLAIFYTLLAVFLISLIDLFIKMLSGHHSVLQLVFFKNLFGLIPLFFLIKKNFNLIRTKRLREHFLRSILALLTTYLLFYSLSLFPFTLVSSISFTSPLFITLLSLIILKEKVCGYSWIAIILGLIGVLVIIRPTGENFNLQILIPFGQVFLYSIGVIFIRVLTKTESDTSIIFYPTIFNLVMCMFIVPFDWDTPKGSNIILLVAIGILASIALLLKTHAYRITTLAVVMPYEYTSILWAMLYDFIFADRIPDIYSLLSIGLISFTGGYLLKIEAQKKQT